jgi:hypothetical protein
MMFSFFVEAILIYCGGNFYDILVFRGCNFNIFWRQFFVNYLICFIDNHHCKITTT